MDTYKIINEFIEKMNYKNNPHVIGCVFHGSALKGNNDKYSDIYKN